MYNKEDIAGLFEDDYCNLSSRRVEEFGFTPDDFFYYTYAVLHSNCYREKYESDLKKQLPRIPKLKNKEQFVEIGRKLADLHLNYGNFEPYSIQRLKLK